MVARSLRAATRKLKKRRRGVAPERLAPCEQEGEGGLVRGGARGGEGKRASTGGLHDAAADFELSPRGFVN